MIASKGKISIRQAVMLFVILIFSPAIRLFPKAAAKAAGKAAWLAPIAAALPTIILILILDAFFKKNKNANLSDVYFKVLGNIAGKIIVLLYLVWTLVLLSLYTRYYSERLLSSMMPNTSNAFLLIVMLSLTFIVSKKGLVLISRTNEIFIILIPIAFLLSFVFSIPQIKYMYLMNVCYTDFLPVVVASADLIGVWGYILFIFFFGDKISNKEHIKRFGFQSLLFISVMSILLLIMTIGTLSSGLTANVFLPYFAAVKNISILEVLSHLESVLLSIWIMSDFVVITVFTLIISSLVKSVFNLSNSKYMIGPISLFAGIGALFFFENRFELETFSSSVVFPLNVTFQFVIPLIVFTIGKLRKKI